MRRVSARLLVGALLLLLVAGSGYAQARPATVILVRHAEKAAEPSADPPLTALGRARADALLDAVRDAGVGVIYSTPLRRNMETARLVANALQVPIIETPIESGKAEAHALDLARRIRAAGGGH
ncbi:MAG TPA: histidine phosphatase family protein, partial [Longimicrobiales bacterium]